MTSKLEYLKRYMSAEDGGGSDETAGKKKKKSKKKKSKVKELGGFRIIDNDIGVNGGSKEESKNSGKGRLGSKIGGALTDEDEDEEDTYALGEEKPQIAALVDDRPPELTGKWKRLNKDDEGAAKQRKRHDSSEDNSPPRRKRHDSSDGDPSPPRKARHDSSDASSPPRRKKVRHDSDGSPPRKGRGANSDSDNSPPRKRRGGGNSDSDKSPPRRRAARRDSSDASPPRHQKMREIKEEPADSDASPPRQNSNRTTAAVKQEPYDSDASPPRQQTRRGDSGMSSSVKVKEEPDSDASPPRQGAKLGGRRESRWGGGDSDTSPPRRKGGGGRDSSDESPPRRGTEKLQTKTLDGKKAGLQSAKGLKSEMEELRRREKERIGSLSADVSGRNAETRIRGRYKEKLDEESKRKEKAAIPEDVKAKYAAWGKGEAQIKAHREKMRDDLHEMSKSLTRTADDADMNDQLKAEDRAEDPMLAYVKQKRAKKVATDTNIEKYPEYKGPQPAPNRFGIKPGYRWDGVDRSTGFEKKLFDTQTKQRVRAQEAHMWSTEDM